MQSIAAVTANMKIIIIRTTFCDNNLYIRYNIKKLIALFYL